MGRYVHHQDSLRRSCLSLTLCSGNLQSMQLGRGNLLRGISDPVPVLHVSKAGRERGHDTGYRDSEQKGYREES